jgi:hypothetical protein
LENEDVYKRNLGCFEGVNEDMKQIREFK